MVLETECTFLLYSQQDVQITLRHAAHALRQARLPPLMTPATAQARLQGEAGVAGPSHTLSHSTPYSLSTLRLREAAWQRIAEALATGPTDNSALALPLIRGASLATAARDSTLGA